MISIADTAGAWPSGVAARRDMALLLMGFAGAHRRSELVALTLADVTLHPTDGLHVRLRTSKTDQEARGTVKALPYGRDPVTCPPCAYVRWRQVLQAWDTATDGAGRRAVLPLLRGQAAMTAVTGGGEQGQEEEPVLHCCRSTIRSPAGEWTLRPADDAVVCGPCAVVRWLKILDLADTKPSTKTIARA